MADIRKRAFVRHLQAGPTAYIHRMRKGRIVSAGPGLTFWFRPLTAAISEIPLEEQEQPLVFRARTADYQEVAVQATITYRIAQPELAVARLDFSIDNDNGAWQATPIEMLGGILTELAQQQAVSLIAAAPLAELMRTGIVPLRSAITVGLQADDWLAETGVDVIGVRVISIRPDRETEIAMQNPVREALQQEADRATYERRAHAVQQERSISENELQNRIELARREEQLVEQQGTNDRRLATEEAAAALIRTESETARVQLTARAQAEHTRVTGEAEADAAAAKMTAYESVEHRTLLALAAQELAGNLPDVGTIVVTPELLSPLLARLGAGDGQ